MGAWLDRARIPFLSAVRLHCCMERHPRKFLLLVFLCLTGTVPMYAQTLSSTSRATAYIPEQPISLPSPNSIWTLGSGCNGCRSGRMLWLVTNADHHRRIIRRYDGTVQAGWSPGGDRFFFNDEESNEKGTAYVVDPTSLKMIELGKLVAAGDPQSAKYLAVPYSHLTARRWAGADALIVELTGNFDKPPIDQFDLQFQVCLTGAVTRLWVREWPLFTPEPAKQ